MKKDNLLPNLIRICIDSYQDGTARGYVYFTTRKEGLPFTDLAKMMLLVDEVLDTQGFPQSFQEKRTFFKHVENAKYVYKPKIVVTSKEFYQHIGKCNTYNILVNTRYHASWQGILLNQDNQEIKSFDDAFVILNELI